MRLSLLLVTLAACAGCGYEGNAPRDGVSTAGSFREEPASEVSAAGTLGETAPVEADEAGAALRAALDANFSPDRTLGYDAARDALYAYEARTHGGQLCDVYAGACAPLSGGDPSQAAGLIGVNAEHTWPQSYGARDEPLRSDLHHLFPSLDRVNTSRGNLPLADVPDERADAWYRDRQSASRLPPGDAAAAWSQRGAGRFEPRDAHKGNAARAVFYVAAVYPEVLTRPGAAAFFETMRPDLLRWHRQDPPDDAERARSAWIARLQGTENPFVTDPSLAERAFDRSVPAPPSVLAPTVRAEADRPSASSSAGLWLSALHYDNVGEDAGEGVEVAGVPDAGLAGWRLVLVNGADGRAYRTVALEGRLDARGRRWVDLPGLQNGSPDGVALIGPAGDVVEFWSYEGLLTASDAPLAGRAAREMSVAEAGDSRLGSALVRDAPDAPWRTGAHPLGR